MYDYRSLSRISREITENIDNELSRAGLFFRIFNRVKTSDSLSKKILSKGVGYYDVINRKVQDLIGIRIIVYFSDDIEIVYEHLKKLFEFVSETIDKNEETTFAPTRINIIYKIPINNKDEFKVKVENEIVDETFEIQLRTIISEGWHEIDHDLRYKSPKEWENNLDLSRNLNGILASLETSEFAILSLFEQLSYRHYKISEVEAMFRTKFRIRLLDDNLPEQLKSLIDESFIKSLFRIDRNEFIKFILNSDLKEPLKMETLIFLLNYRTIKNPAINNIIPKVLKNIFIKLI